MEKAVMIVDDDAGIRSSIPLALRSIGCKVIQASDGPSCLKALREGFRGVILMDVMMPGMTGWQTIRAIVEGELLNGSLICMLTAVTEPGSEADNLQELVFDYLPKPFTIEKLRAMVENAFQCLAP